MAPLQALLDAQAGELRDALGELTIAKADAAAAKARADTLAAQVEREVMDRRTLQSQGDAIRDQLAAVQDRARRSPRDRHDRARHARGGRGTGARSTTPARQAAGPSPAPLVASLVGPRSLTFPNMPASPQGGLRNPRT